MENYSQSVRTNREVLQPRPNVVERYVLVGILTDLAKHPLPPGGAVARIGSNTLASVHALL